MPGCGRRRSMPRGDQEIARSESSALTSVRVLPDARITTEGPIAPDRPASNQLLGVVSNQVVHSAPVRRGLHDELANLSHK
jgi:hypothetical protein